MHIRLRSSKQEPLKQDVFLVQENGKEDADPALQKCWDDEQKAQQEEFDPDDNPPTPLYVRRSPHPRIKTPADIVIEFRHLGCRYTLSIANGLTQWSFEKIRNVPKKARHANVKSYHHKFFSEDLICLDRNTVDNLAALFAGCGTSWICSDEASHEHYVVKVYLELSMTLQSVESPDPKHVIHVVCGDAKLVDVFRGICGDKLKDQFSFTQLYFGPEGSMVLGASYTYLTAMTGQILVKDLGWNVGDDRTVWVLPPPCDPVG